MAMGQYHGQTLELARSEAENLVMTGQARWETRPLPKAETPGSPDLSELTRPQLEAMAEARGVKVVRADGEDGLPLKADYIRALGG